MVFCDVDGGHLRKSNFYRRSFLHILESAKRKGHDLPRITFHGLRHTCASLLLLAGENPKVVSERLGHKSVQTTLTIYAHVMPGMQQAAAEKLEASLRLATIRLQSGS